jgi:F0F1-type ATP synthase assembly protein I
MHQTNNRMGKPMHETSDKEGSDVVLSPPPPPKRLLSSLAIGTTDRMSKPTLQPITGKDSSNTTTEDNSNVSKTTTRSRAGRVPNDDYDSDDDSSDDEEVQRPGAHRINGSATNPAVSSRSLVSITSEKTNSDPRYELQTAISIHEEVDEETKVRIQQAAHLKVELQIRDQAVKAEEETDPKRAAEARLLRRQCTVAGVLCFLFVAGTIVGVLFGFVIDKQEPSPTNKPTLAPTPIPPIYNPGDNEYNNECGEAFGIEGAIGAPIIGSTKNATTDHVDACDIISSNGQGVWYRMAGDDRRMMASTCDDTFFDTQISIFIGDCGGLKCIAGNDQMSCGNGDQSMVAWYAESGVEYLIYVHGHRKSSGLFQLAVNPMEDNDYCEKATSIDAYSDPVFGSTRGATNDEAIHCGTARQSAAGVWYTTLGTGDIISASVLTEDTTSFRGQVSLFKGDDCGNLDCVDGSIIGFGAWESERNAKYFILVHGQGILEGDFRLHLGRLPGIPPREGDYCQALEAAPILTAGSSSSGSTKGAPIYHVASCGNLVFSTAGGTWFKTVGTGGASSVSTCYDTTNFDTQISVFTGTCDGLECIAGNDQASECDGSTVSWFTLKGEEYFILGKSYAAD